MTLRSPTWEQKFLRFALLERREKQKAVADELQRLVQPDNLSSMFDVSCSDTIPRPPPPLFQAALCYKVARVFNKGYSTYRVNIKIMQRRCWFSHVSAPCVVSRYPKASCRN